jgi:hypothetical protein
MVSQDKYSYGILELFQVERFLHCENQFMAKLVVDASHKDHTYIKIAAFCVKPETIVTLNHVCRTDSI